jgi:hypothetical protein
MWKPLEFVSSRAEVPTAHAFDMIFNRQGPQPLGCSIPFVRTHPACLCGRVLWQTTSRTESAEVRAVSCPTPKTQESNQTHFVVLFLPLPPFSTPLLPSSLRSPVGFSHHARPSRQAQVHLFCHMMMLFSLAGGRANARSTKLRRLKVILFAGSVFCHPHNACLCT